MNGKDDARKRTADRLREVAEDILGLGQKKEAPEPEDEEILEQIDLDKLLAEEEPDTSEQPEDVTETQASSASTEQAGATAADMQEPSPVGRSGGPTETPKSGEEAARSEVESGSEPAATMSEAAGADSSERGQPVEEPAAATTPGDSYWDALKEVEVAEQPAASDAGPASKPAGRRSSEETRGETGRSGQEEREGSEKSNVAATQAAVEQEPSTPAATGSDDGGIRVVVAEEGPIVAPRPSPRRNEFIEDDDFGAGVLDEEELEELLSEVGRQEPDEEEVVEEQTPAETVARGAEAQTEIVTEELSDSRDISEVAEAPETEVEGEEEVPTREELARRRRRRRSRRRKLVDEEKEVVTEYGAEEEEAVDAAESGHRRRPRRAKRTSGTTEEVEAQAATSSEERRIKHEKIPTWEEAISYLKR